ncbi:MAG: DUF5979 domain-containing protein [Eubacteriales bacterium]|nr:DUF5979 domain-containing protein [Eubacteriales bacterium]
MRRVKKWLLFVLLAIFGIVPCVNIALERTAQAGAQNFVCPNETVLPPINLINGSFQTPVFTLNSSYNPSPTRPWIQYDMGDVPGWSTIPVDPDDYSNEHAYYIEFQKVNSAGGDGTAKTAADGDQYLELNCYVPGRVYQDVATTPGSKLYWSFAHHARNNKSNPTGTGSDVMNLYMRPSGTPESTPEASQLINTFSDNGLRWYFYSGTYTVPEGQTSTEMAFGSVSSASNTASTGNLVDAVILQTASNLIAKKSVDTSAADDATALKSEIVTINITITNWGETDASQCVFHDVLSDGLDYVDGSAKINGLDANTLAAFDSTTDELRINFGTGATAGAGNTHGGRLKGSISMGTSGSTGEGETATLSFEAKVTGNYGFIVKNQASVTYNDYNLESLNASGNTCYSSVLGKTPAEGDETTYVNQFTILDRALSGVAWYDANGDGVIDGDETRASGLTVGLFDSSDTNYTTLVNDNDGNPLIAVTDSSGAYSFSEIPQGTYAAVITTPEDYDVTVLANDNDAAADREYAVIGGIDMTNLGAITNKDFGFVQKNGNTYLLILSKRIKGDLADPMDEFSFTITLNGLTGSLPYTGRSTIAEVSPPADGTISNGGTVTLRHGQQIAISGVPEGTTYTITESGGDGYTTTVSGDNASGTVTADTEVEFVNTKNKVLPTSAALDSTPYLVILLLAGGVVTLSIIVSRNSRVQRQRANRRGR